MPRSKSVHIRLTTKEHQKLLKYANENELTVSEVIRDFIKDLPENKEAGFNLPPSTPTRLNGWLSLATIFVYKHGYTCPYLGDYQEAIFSYQQALKLAPNDNYSWYNQACCAAKLGKVELSLTSLQQA